MPLLGWFVFKKINKSCSKNAVSRPICLQKSRFGRKKTFATISVVISSSSWLLRAMDPCRLLLDFKNRLFAPSKKNYHVQKKTIPSKKLGASRVQKKTISFKKKLGASRRSVQKKIQKKTPAASRLISFKKKLQNVQKKTRRFAPTFKKKLQNSFFLNGSVQKKTLQRISVD